MSLIENMMKNIIRWFASTDENVKVVRNDLSGLGKKVDSHAVSSSNLSSR